MSNKTKGNLSLTQFFKLVHKSLDIAWGKNWGQFVKAYPAKSEPNDITLPLITYRLKSKRPQVMGSTQEIKPRMRGQFPDPNDPQNTIEVWGQRFECIVEFATWESDELKVSELADRFEEFMQIYTRVFKELGVVDVVFAETTDEPPPNQWRVDLTPRYTRYLVIVDKLTPTSLAVLNKMKLQLLDEDDNVVETIDPLHKTL
jgi:hypothetical protein